MRTTWDASFSFHSTAALQCWPLFLAWVATPGTRNTECALIKLHESRNTLHIGVSNIYSDVAACLRQSQNTPTTPWSLQWHWRLWRAPASEPRNGTFQKWPYPRVWWGVWNLAHFLKLFCHVLCHPFHTFVHMATIPKAFATPAYTNAHVSCQFKCHWDVLEAYTVNTYT